LCDIERVSELSVTMSLRDLIFHVLLISIVRSSMALPVIIYPKLLILWLSPDLGSKNDQEGLERLANRWKLMHSAFNTPQLETHKNDIASHDSWMFPDKYKYLEREREYVR
jgi:hypothetical protein